MTNEKEPLDIRQMTAVDVLDWLLSDEAWEFFKRNPTPVLVRSWLIHNLITGATPHLDGEPKTSRGQGA